MRVALLASVLLLLAACTAPPLAFTPTDDGPGAPAMAGVWTKGELIDLFVHLREAERRREPEGACQALHFTSQIDQRFYLQELYFLAGVPSGPVCAASEIHLVGAPPAFGPGDYLFLEPVRGRYQATFLTVVDLGGRPRVLYQRPDVTEEERAKLRPADLVATATRRRAAHWQSLRGRDLQAESDRLKRMLSYQIEAQGYAAREGLDLTPFAPNPATLRAELQPLPPEEVRARVLGLLAPATG